MADFAHDLDAQRRLRAIEQKMVHGGGPPHNGGMEDRVKALEEAVKNLPTKADFAELRADIAKGQADMHKAMTDNHRWTHGALIGIGTIATAGILGVISTIWSMGKPSSAPAAAQPSPIIINVPASSSGDEKENGRAKEPPPAQQ